MSVGTVVIASDIDAHREVLQDNVNGLIVDFSDVNQIAERVLRVVGDRVKREQIVAAAKQSVSGQSWEACAKKYIQLFTR